MQIYLIVGNNGDDTYEDNSTWCVKAFADKVKAKNLVDILNEESNRVGDILKELGHNFFEARKYIKEDLKLYFQESFFQNFFYLEEVEFEE